MGRVFSLLLSALLIVAIGGLSGCGKKDPCRGDDWEKKAKRGCKNLEGADLVSAYLQKVNLEGANLEGANLWGADLYYADFTNAKLHDADLNGARLIEANLNGADLSGTNLRSANLRHAKLINANLTGANLTNAKMHDVNLTKATLKGTNLEGAVMNYSKLAYADLTDVTWDDTTCPDDTNSDTNGGSCCGHFNGKGPSAGCSDSQRKYKIKPDSSATASQRKYKIKLGSSEAAGFCKREDIAKAVRRRAGAIRSCYEKQLMIDPQLKGKIMMQWKIGLDGGVKSANATGGSLKNRKVVQCVERIIRRMRFVKPDGGVCVVRWPFVFNAGD